MVGGKTGVEWMHGDCVVSDGYETREKREEEKTERRGGRGNKREGAVLGIRKERKGEGE